MSSVAVVAFGAVSALGEGQAAVSAGQVGDSARVAIERDVELVNAGLARPFAARCRALNPDDELRASSLLERASTACASELDRVCPTWRGQRVAMVIGTSSGGMRSAERAFAAVERGDRLPNPEAMTYFGPVALAARALGLIFDPSLVILGACASSTLAMGIACRWLELGACDLALAGGFDDVTVFVAAGFEALRATTGCPPPRPFRLGRDGMSLGEGAAVLALARAESQPLASGAPLWSPPDLVALGHVAGVGAASDAMHLTAPDRQGRGLARAAEAALAEAGNPTVDLVGAHATATPFNDAAEARAIARVLGAGRARETVVHPFKAQVGHTLGAAGALEALVCLDAIKRQVLPAAAGEGGVDPEAPATLLDRTTAARPQAALKLSSAFGGSNAALVLAAQPGPRALRRRPVFLHAATSVDAEPSLEEIAAEAHTSVDRLSRADALVRLALSAVGRLERSTGGLAGAGIVVGSALATVETSARFSARIRQSGARAAHPFLFPYTSPNAASGECSIAFRLTGPSFTVGGGLNAGVEALAAAALLIEAGDAERVVVVATDEAGTVTRAMTSENITTGAVALLLTCERQGALAVVGDVMLRRGVPVSGPTSPGHIALLPLVGRALPRAVRSTNPPDAIARVEIHPL